MLKNQHKSCKISKAQQLLGFFYNLKRNSVIKANLICRMVCMNIFAMIILTLGAVSGFEWLMRNLLALAVWKRMFHLRADYKSQATLPKLSVVVAAKDEQDNIANCINSLLKQDYPDFEIVVIDDRSDDDTAKIVRDIAKIDSRVRLVQVVSLPAGWCGKNHAMQRGIETVTSDYILMTDADCTFNSDKTLRVAMQYMIDNDADMLSLTPTLKMHSFWERLLQPVLGGVLMIWFSPGKVCNPKKPHAFANGQFMMMKRSSYQAIGSHEAIKGSLIEDMDLARNIKSSGHKLLFRQSEDLFAVRMYSNRAQIVRGWIRIFTGVFQTFIPKLKALIVLWGKGLTPFVTSLISLIMFAIVGGDLWAKSAIICSAGLVTQLIMMVRYYKFNQAGKWYGLIYPFASLYAGLILVKSMLTLRSGAKIIWRGTTYEADQGKK